MAETESFGQRLWHQRREIDLTQKELARQVGCAPIMVRTLLSSDYFCFLIYE
jgi:transcriptional regulator with XRE-family HTH domain